MNSTEFQDLLKSINACVEAREWAEGKTSDEVIDTCHRGDWLLWLARKLDMDIRKLTLAKGHCANTVRHLMKDERSINAVDAAIAFGEGKISTNELKAAADAAAADAAAYAAAADDAADAAAAVAVYSAAYATATATADATATATADAAYAYAYAYAYTTAADAAAAVARDENMQITADICRQYIGEELKKLIKEREGGK